MTQMIKYPRTLHIQGSKLQRGDDDLKRISFQEIQGKHLVIEEKIDGANSGLSFDSAGQLLIQSRGHYLQGGARERQFDLLKQWATSISSALYNVLSDRYILYGEWMYAKHTVFYDALPHYFMEFDIWDREQQVFLSTPNRKELLKELPVHSVLVLYEGSVSSFKELQSWLGRSHFISEQRIQKLRDYCEKNHHPWEQTLQETDLSEKMEGLYVKWEEDGVVKGRYKYIRDSFTQSLLDSDSHWMDRKLLPNQLQEGVQLFSALES